MQKRGFRILEQALQSLRMIESFRQQAGESLDGRFCVAGGVLAVGYCAVLALQVGP